MLLSVSRKHKSYLYYVISITYTAGTHCTLTSASLAVCASFSTQRCWFCRSCPSRYSRSVVATTEVEARSRGKDRDQDRDQDRDRD